jgi:hypothetical protein
MPNTFDFSVDIPADVRRERGEKKKTQNETAWQCSATATEREEKEHLRSGHTAISATVAPSAAIEALTKATRPVFLRDHASSCRMCFHFVCVCVCVFLWMEGKREEEVLYQRDCEVRGKACDSNGDSAQLLRHRNHLCLRCPLALLPVARVPVSSVTTTTTTITIANAHTVVMW